MLRSITWTRLCVGATLTLALLSASAFAADPVLSDRVRKLIADKGVEAARQEAPMLVVAAQGQPVAALAVVDELPCLVVGGVGVLPDADQAGTIVKILVEDGQPVEYNQPLFIIE